MCPFLLLPSSSGGKPALFLIASAVQFMLQQGYKNKSAAYHPMLLLLVTTQ